MFVRDKIPKIFFFWLGFIILCMVKSSQLIPRESFFNSLLNILNLGSGANVAFTMGGILLSLIIVKHSHVIVQRKVIFIVSVAVILLIAAAISNNLWIISKNRATPPWVLYCTSAAIVTYGLVQWTVYKGKASWFNIIKPAGTATLTCYLVPYVLYSLFGGIMNLSIPDWMKEGGVGLVKCAGFALFCVGITALLERFNVKLKI